MKRPRPYVPLPVRCAVAERQVLALRSAAAVLELASTQKMPTLKQRLIGALCILFPNGEKFALDHDPPLRARPYNPRIKDVAARYTPNANDPNHLFYRAQDVAAENSHHVKTFIRGDHGQYSDTALIKRERRRENRKAGVVKKKSKIAQRKNPWGKRKMGGKRWDANTKHRRSTTPSQQ